MTSAPELRLAKEARARLITARSTNGHPLERTAWLTMEGPFLDFLNLECWRPQRSRVLLAGRRFSARVVAFRSGEPLILCEIIRSSAWPDYFERRSIRRAIGRRLREDRPITAEWVAAETEGADPESRPPSAAAQRMAYNDNFKILLSSGKDWLAGT